MADYVVEFTGRNNLSQAAQGVKKDLEAINNEAGKVGENVSKYDAFAARFEKISNSTKPLKAQLGSLKRLLADMNMEGFDDHGLMTEVAMKAGQISDSIKDANDAVNRFASDTHNLDAGIQAFQLGAAGASVLTGAMGMLGVESEKTTKMILKVQSALAILNGVQQIANLLNKDSALMQRLKAVRLAATTKEEVQNTVALTANTVAERANTTATAAATVAQNGWNTAKAIAKALLGDFTGLILLGVGAMTTYAIATAGATDEQDEMNDKVKQAKDAQDEYQKSLKDTANSVIIPLYASFLKLQTAWKGLSTEAQKTEFLQQYKEEIKSLGLEINNLTDAENAFINNADNFVNSIIMRAKKAVLLKQLEKILEESSLSDAATPTQNNPTALNQGKYSIGQLVATDIAKQIADIESELYKMTPKSKPTKTTTKTTTTTKTEVQFSKGSLADLEAQLNAAKKRLTTGMFQGNETQESLTQLVQDLEAKVKEKKIELKFDVSETQKKLEEANKQFSKVNTTYTPKTSTFDEATGNNKKRLDALKDEMDFNDDLIQQLKELLALYESLGNVEGIKAVNEQLGVTAEKQTELAGQAKTLHGQIEDKEKEAEAWGYYAQMLSSTADAFSILGDSEEAAAAKFALGTGAILADAVKTIAAMNAEALAKGASSAFALPFPANLAAWATILTTITSIFAALPKFAEGGIVGGSMYEHPIMAHKGEVILNERQQKTLFDAIDKGNVGGSGSIARVVGRVRGKDLELVLDNNKRSKSRAGINLTF